MNLVGANNIANHPDVRPRHRSIKHADWMALGGGKLFAELVGGNPKLHMGGAEEQKIRRRHALPKTKDARVKDVIVYVAVIGPKVIERDIAFPQIGRSIGGGSFR